MPALNKQTLINLLIDSPLREPIKINLIDIINNTQDTDLPKVYPTVIKELEIFQKATERRMKLADETIAKLNESGVAPTTSTPTTSESAAPAAPSSLPPLPPLPPLPTMPTPPAIPSEPTPLSVPPLDLPPLPGMDTAGSSLPPLPPLPPMPTTVPVMPTPATPAAPVMPTPSTQQVDADEAALAEIQKELDALKSGAAADAQ